MKLAHRQFAQSVQLLEKSDRMNNGAIPLAADTSYTSPKIDCEHWAWIIGTCYADQKGRLKCQFSEDDGEHWDGEHESVQYEAEDRMVFAFEVAAQWGRLVFVNDNRDQNKFRLHVQLRRGI